MKQVKLITIEPHDNGYTIKIIREQYTTQKNIVWSTKALFLILADLLDYPLHKQNWATTHHQEN